MHEYYITEELVRIACEVADEHQAASILGITIVIGERAGIVPDSVEFCFEALSKGTRAEGAKLTFIMQPAFRFCPACRIEYEDRLGRFCPECGLPGDMIQDGRQFAFHSIELPD